MIGFTIVEGTCFRLEITVVNMGRADNFRRFVRQSFPAGRWDGETDHSESSRAVASDNEGK